MKETIPQLTISNWRKTNGVSEEKKLNEMRSSCEKCPFFLLRVEIWSLERCFSSLRLQR